MARTKKLFGKDSNYIDRIESEIKSNQSTLSLVLGVLIVLVLGVLLFNYFNRGQIEEPGIQTNQTVQQMGDVSPEDLPGKYTVKEGDTLYLIADKYYKDGFKYPELVKANNLQNENAIEVGQVLDIPKLETQAQAQATATPSSEAEATPEPTEVAQITTDQTQQVKGGVGGANTTIWGTRIEENSYTVVEGDWLSTIAGRAYGDIYAYDKLAKANNITNPDLITPGMVLTIPR